MDEVLIYKELRKPNIYNIFNIIITSLLFIYLSFRYINYISMQQFIKNQQVTFVFLRRNQSSFAKNVTLFCSRGNLFLRERLFVFAKKVTFWFDGSYPCFSCGARVDL